MYTLSPGFSYVINRATGKGYIVSGSGARSTLNLDAMDLLTAEDAGWQEDADYADFLAQARALQWLVPGPAARAAQVRHIDRQVHLKRIQYEINLLCNLECQHCYCSSSPRASAGRSTEFVLDLVRQAAELGVLHFDLTGGEPLVRKDIFQILESIREHGMTTTLFTNCTLIKPETARRIREAGVAAVQTSLDACTPELHDQIRGRGGAFQRALQGIDALRAEGVPVSVTITLNRLNVGQAADIVRFMTALNVPFYFDRVIPAGRAASQSGIALSNAEFYAVMRQLEKDGAVPKMRVCEGPVQISESKIEPSCGVGESYAFIKHDGRMALCPTMTEAESAEFAQADLGAMSLAEAWEQHPTFMRTRGMQCENARVCPAGKTCRGGCRSNAYLLHGRLDSPDEMNCNLFKNAGDSYHDFLGEYARARGASAAPEPTSSNSARPSRAAHRRLAVLQ
ncbi:MAG: radical SAM protein [Deltaproteobacteria bacterium]